MFEGLKKKFSEALKVFAKKEENALGAHDAEAAAHDEGVHKPGAAAEAGPEARARAASEHAAARPTRAVRASLSVKTRIKSALLPRVRLNAADADSFLESLQRTLLEANVAYQTSEQFINALRPKLLGAELESRRIEQQTADNVRAALLEVLERSRPRFRILDRAEEMARSGSAPVKILFLGPNGTGKTTTIAKLAYAMKLRGMRPVLSASDTFRAAAIEQAEHHAKRLGVPIIKGRYGADPASVAFDAIAYARAHHADAVLIDTAGRQETNKNLIGEIEKMVRVAKPDMTIFVGESIAGNMMAEQINTFSSHVKIDGIILTKLDCDPKGGSAISVAEITGIPVLFFGTGEAYGSLAAYDPAAIADAIVPRHGSPDR